MKNSTKFLFKMVSVFLLIGFTVIAKPSFSNTGEGSTPPCSITPRARAVLNVTLNSSGFATLLASQVDSGSTASCGIQFLNLSRNYFTCWDATGSGITTWLYVQATSGDIDSVSATVYVTDINAPVVTPKPNLNLYLNTYGAIWLDSSDLFVATHDCGISSYTLSKSTLYCSDKGDVSIGYSVTSYSGLTTTGSVLVSVLDTIPPSNTCQNTTVYIDSNGQSVLLSPSMFSGQTFDNCNATFPVLSIVDTMYYCSDIGVKNVIVTATDASGNTYTCVSVTTIADLNPPNVHLQTDTVYLDANGNGSNTLADLLSSPITEGCGIQSIVLSDSIYTCSNIGWNSVKVYAADVHGNRDTIYGGVEVLDTIPPVIRAKNITVYIGAGGSVSLNPDSINDGTTDNCGINYFLLDSTAATCADLTSGGFNVTLTAYDFGGNSSSTQAYVTVLDTSTTQFYMRTDTLYLDSNGIVSLSFSDVVDSISSTCSILSSGINPTGFTCADVGLNMVTAYAQRLDFVNPLLSKWDYDSIQVLVLDTISPKLITSPQVVFGLYASGSLTISASDLVVLSNDSCGIQSLTISKSYFDCSDTSSMNTVIVTATDVHGNTTSKNVIVGIEDRVQPVAIARDDTVYLDASGQASISVNSINNGSYDNCLITSMTLSDSIFDCSDLGVNQVLFSVYDYVYRLSPDTEMVNVTVMDTIFPTLVTRNDTIYLSTIGQATLQLSDVNNGSFDNCSFDSLYLTKTAFTCDDIGTNTISLIGVDPAGNRSSSSAIITVIDSIPVTITPDNPVRVYLDSNGQGVAVARDYVTFSPSDCKVSSVKMQLSNPLVPAWNGPIVSQLNVDCNYGNQTINIITYFKDGDSNVINNIPFIVSDTLRPQAFTNNDTLYLDANGADTLNLSDINNNSTDNCTISSVSLSKSNFNCADIGTNTINLVVEDDSQNRDSTSAVITVLDTISPVMVAHDITVYLNNQGNVSITENDIDSSSTDNCTLFLLTIDVNTFGCTDVGANTVTLTGIDNSGNSSITTAVVTVLDTIAPVINTTSINAYLDSNGLVTVSRSSLMNLATDNCGIDNAIIADSNFHCGHIGTQTKLLDVIDQSGNLDTATITIHVLDTLAPNVIGQNISVSLDSNGQARINTTMVNNGSTDNCQLDASWLSDTLFSCADTGAHQVWYTVQDVSGNRDSIQVTVTVVDSLNIIDTANFSYSAASFCANLANPVASITATQGGVFSAPFSNLLLDSLTGEINLLQSPVGFHTIMYKTNGVCSDSSYQNVTINAFTSAAFSYADSNYCSVFSLTYLPSIQNSGGVFTATPNGLVIDSLTGRIEPGSSAISSYAVQYKTTLGCPDSNVVSINVVGIDNSNFHYSDSVYNLYPPNAVPTITGTTGGIFSSNVPANCIVNGSTGEIDFTNSVVGNYEIKYLLSDACKTFSIFDIRLFYVNIITSVNGNRITSNAQNATFQWVDCNNNYAFIPGATDSIFKAPQSGSYAVIVTQNGNSDTSDCVTLVNVGVGDFELKNELKVYPNPTSDVLNIEIDNWNATQLEIALISMEGKTVYRNEIQNVTSKQQLILRTQTFSTGIYLLRITDGTKVRTQRVVVK